jgi:hypothetical protein
MPIRVDRYRLDVQLDPATHRLVGRAKLDFVRMGSAPVTEDEPVAVELRMHPDLKISHVSASGAKVTERRSRRTLLAEGESTESVTHSIVLDGPVDAATLFIDYQGVLYQDVAAGEVAGRIHNFEMRAHIADEGIFLADGYWYPQPHQTPSGATLSEFTLLASQVSDMKLVASGERDPSLSAQTGRIAWRAPYPLDRMVLVGGPHDVHQTEHNGISLNLHLKPSQSHHADGLATAIARNLDRYQPLVGAYPLREFAVVDNFFSSGFAFPAFTLLSSMVIDMGERAQNTHGYFDHELLHSWWGNGIFVDPSDGNWCEALATYGANYYGHVLDGDEDEARRVRRNYSHFLSRIESSKDKPLGTYGLKDGCGRGIAYNKGAMVFHMLARRMGQDRFWAAMRRFSSDFLGRYAGWDEIRNICEAESGEPLDAFFEQWVRRSGAPQIRVESARFDPRSGTLSVSLNQTEPFFEVDLPIRLTSERESVERVVPVEAHVSTRVSFPVDFEPQTVEIDPDYHVFRKIPERHIIPTTATTRGGKALATISRRGDTPQEYEQARKVFASSFPASAVDRFEVGSIPEGALASRSVLILGDAVRDSYVAGFLAAIEFPVRFVDSGFEFEGAVYTDADDAVLCTVNHPGSATSGVTVLFANSEEAIPPARNLPMYDRSLVIFHDQHPVLRRDFEHAEVVPVERS